ncbi:GntR family transcriptional regulator [Kaistia sp. UC242_56]|mgnify:CR=1 FL=1|uniref:GntR family transcriptional regulator n=1 Tax=Kaistia sp. UC242_56 TaxID=3374625 RepID=UPI0037971EDC
MKASKTDPVADSSPDASGAAASLESFQPRALSRDDGPLYRQLVTILREPIANGTLVPGTSLPREADIAERFGVSLITVRQALRDLENDGLIKKRAAKPAIVAVPELPAQPSFDFRSFAQIAESTKGRALEIHSYRKERSAAASAAFGLKPEESCHCLRATLHQKDGPACQTTFYFPPAIGSRLKRPDFDDVVVFRAVQRHLGIQLSSARITVRADIADEALAEALDYKVGGPILVMEMLYFSAAGEPVELTINKNRADLFSLSYDAPNDLG